MTRTDRNQFALRGTIFSFVVLGLSFASMMIASIWMGITQDQPGWVSFGFLGLIAVTLVSAVTTLVIRRVLARNR